MEAFLFLTDQEETDPPKRLVVVSTQHISEARPSVTNWTKVP
jgi:hypothetical protein